MASPSSSPPETRTTPTPDLPSSPALHTSLAHQNAQYNDCTSCRIMGSAAFTGLGFYTYYSGRKQLREREAEFLKAGSRFGVRVRKMMILGMSMGLVGLGAWRLVD
ncbi:uncharacterized protein LTR77_009572 [Saxophila tyrrhenica]|uniref:Distal membrane-arm assembly complex protein 1-like domain-containing protein n=1 Tax=Saxophila tyrrhenica TaxID=1690608 RepID=A0AAV9NY14_9PEZI|nr:hypothetical protein LTR77_009572 [Saxophila tyrrhenica]